MDGCMKYITLSDVQPRYVRYWLLYIVRSSILLIVYGIATIVYGATNKWRQSDELGNVYIYPIEVPHYGPTTFLYGFGIYFMFTGILGMSVAVHRKNSHASMLFILRTYILGPIVPVSLSLIFIIVQSVLWNYTRESLQQLLRSYQVGAVNSAYDWQKARMDEIQIHYQCCGIESYKDWAEIPNSCCIHRYYGLYHDFYQHKTGCDTYSSKELLTDPSLASRYVYKGGCVENILHRYRFHYIIVGAFIVAYIFIVVIGIMYAFHLIHYYKRLPQICDPVESIEMNNIDNRYVTVTLDQRNNKTRRQSRDLVNHTSACNNSRVQTTASPVLDMDGINQNHVALLQNYENVVNERLMTSPPHTVI